MRVNLPHWPLLILCALLFGCATPENKNEQQGTFNLNIPHPSLKLKAEDSVTLRNVYSKMLENKPHDANEFYSDSSYALHFRHPVARAILRDLLKDYPLRNKGRMVGPQEPGELIHVRVKLVERASRHHLPDVTVQFVHTDSSGKYFDEDGPWNPRIFGYYKSNESGLIYLSTNRPGGYKDDEGNWNPPHIHFSTSRAGLIDRNGEFNVGGDENDALNAEYIDSLKAYYVVIPLDEEN